MPTRLRRWRPTGRRWAGRAATARRRRGSRSTAPPTVAWALRRIDEREVAAEVKQVQVRKAPPALRHAGRAGLPGSPPCVATSARRWWSRAASATFCTSPPEARTTPPSRPRWRCRRCTGWAAGSGAGRVVDHLLGQDPGRAGLRGAALDFRGGLRRTASEWRTLLDQLLFDGLLREDPERRTPPDGAPAIPARCGRSIGRAQGGGARAGAPARACPPRPPGL